MTTLKPDMHPTLNDQVLSRLRSQKILTVFDMITEKPEKLSRCTGLLYKDILSIRKILQERFGGKCVKISEQLSVLKKSVISTSIPCLDILLDNGLSPGQMYELCGTSASGKTQLCLTLAINIAMNNRSLVYYIDTKGDFCGSRIVEMFKAFKGKEEDMYRTMNNIKVSSVRNAGQLLKTLNHFVKMSDVSRDELPPKIIIIDSLPAVLFKFTNDNSANYLLNNLSNLCRYTANRCNLSVLTVNLLTQGNFLRGSDQKTPQSNNNNNAVRPALGKYWLHVPSTRLLIEKSGQEYMKITVWKSFQSKVNAVCKMRLTNGGVIPAA